MTDEVSYTTRERVQQTLDQADAVRNNALIDRCIRAASRDLEGVCHRRFYPTVATRYPDPRWAIGETLWLNHVDYELASITSLLVDGTALVQDTDFYAEAQVLSGAYTAIRLLRGSNAAWSADQLSIALTGLFGGSNSTDAGGALVATINASVTTMTIPDSSLIGVGDLVLIDSERVIVTGKALVDSTATLSATLAASAAGTLVAVSDGTKLHVGEQITIGSERMFVEQIAGNNLIVKRAQTASVLATHAISDVVYVPRTCTITRAAAGTTAASHTLGAAMLRNRPPSLVAEATAAIAIVYAEQGKAGWPVTRTAGSGDSARLAPGGGIDAITQDVYNAYGRRGRMGLTR